MDIQVSVACQILTLLASWIISFNHHLMLVPPRGDPDASNQLTARNQANSQTYRALEDDEYDVFTSRVFYALGGYPDYSAITVTDDAGVFGDASVLVPEVPKLSHEEEQRYRPLYEKLVDLKKVERDRKLNTPAASAHREEKRSHQSIKKIAHQVGDFIFVFIPSCISHFHI